MKINTKNLIFERVSLGNLSLYIRDFNFIKIDELFVLDNRSFCKFYCDTIFAKHTLFFTFFYKTGIMPYHIRLLFFFLELVLGFVLNAIFFTDSFISEKNRTILITDLVIINIYLINFFL
jgi:hypothetical protein